MKVQITFKEDAATGGRKVETYSCNRVTFPAQLPYMVIGAYPATTELKRSGKSQSIFLPDIWELVISD